MTLALRDDPDVIIRYRDEHAHAWPEVLSVLRSIGIREMRIFLLACRLFMYMETIDGFDPRRDFARLEEDATYRRWSELMMSLQEKVAEAAPDEWWAEMEPVFDLSQALRNLS
jgi:L-rhamnose mutarotase